MKVSVAIATYNHEKYLAQTLDSVLMQQVDFDYEIIVGEDCSTDNTRAVLMDYQAKHPHIIKPILQKENVGTPWNGIAVLDACTGEYIALLDGDDYWIDPLKLKKQVDFLDANPDYSLCFTAYQSYYENDSRFSDPFFLPHRKQSYTLEDLFEGNIISTPTVMYRRQNLPEYPEWLYKMPAADYGLFVINAQCGKLGYLDEVMVVYRRHNGGIWSAQDHVTVLRKELENLTALCEYLGPEYYKKIFPYFNDTFCMLMDHSILNYNPEFAYKYSKLCIKYKTDATFCEAIKFYIRPYIPRRFWYALRERLSL